MAVNETAPPTATAPGAPHKEEILVDRDFAMLVTACRYNLTDRAEAQRSAHDLVELFFTLAKILQVDLFIEAGAKEADSSRRARRTLKPERVVAFEANPFTYKRFARVNADATGVEYEHLALSDEPGTVTLNVRRAADGRPSADGQASLLTRASDQSTDFVEITVDATTLDLYFGDQDFERAALWIDVEGAARPVLNGGRVTLEKAAVVIVEVEDRRFWGEDQWLRPEVLSYLYDRGLVPVARDFQSRYQYNIVLVRSNLFETVDQVRWAVTLFSSGAYGNHSLRNSVQNQKKNRRIRGLWRRKEVLKRVTRKIRGCRPSA
ncbi:MAG: FkbM family methyltransferase [Actinomycetales bacterium]|nr:FkbM family methyltransferase [Actinomycetales bacterium]